MSRPLLHCLVALLGAGLLTGGCLTPFSEEELETRLEVAAEPFEALGRRRLIPIYAETRFIAKALLTEARVNPESPLTTQVSKRLGIAARRKFHVVVGGPYSDLSDRVLRNAFALHRKQGLAGLTVVYVSNARPSFELARAANEARAQLHHRPLP